MKELTYPFDERQIRALKAGDAVEISGLVHTGRDKFHKFFADGGKIAVDFRDGALYHCGPVCVKAGDGWRVVSAGPTTSVRENPYEPKFIASSGVRIIIGKGGMDAATLAAMKKHGCVYVQALFEEFGAAEACWHFEVEGFRGVVAMDAHGNSLFDKVASASDARLREIL